MDHADDRGRAVLIGIAAVLGVLAVSSGARCLAETATLQQGADGYAGCTAQTLWEPKTAKPKEGAGDGMLCIRGTVTYSEKDEQTGKTRQRESANRVLLKFDLPSALRGKKLARARLEVFVPEVRRLRVINEILCREVTQPWTAGADWENAAPERKWSTPGGMLDAATDYDNGRPKGAVDSYAFWELNGQYFPHKYDFLQCPEGGKWIDFNVTPLARKWLNDPQANHGVALHPVSQGDRRGEFMNRMEIDIPSPGSAKAAHRPRLVMEFEPLGETYLVGMTDGLRKYCDRSTRYRFFGPFDESHEMAMARNEFEPFQVMVYPLAGEMKSVTFECGDLIGPGGAKIPAADVSHNCQEMVKMHPNGKTGDWYFHGKEFWIPDPLSHARPVDLREHVSTPFWFTVRTRPQTKAGTYRGTITVKAANAAPRPLKLTVRVWDYQVPQRWNFQTMGQTCWGYIWQCYPKRTREDTVRLQRAYIDFLMDHRFMPTEQYSSNLSPSLADMPYCVTERGGNTIYLNGNFRLPNLPGDGSPEIGKLKAAHFGSVDKMLLATGQAEEFKKCQQACEAAKAEAGKVRGGRARAEAVRKVEAKYEADRIALLTKAGKADELARLTQGHEADKAEEMARLTKAYETAKAAALKALRDRYDAVIALDEKLRAGGKYDDVERLIDMSLVYIGDETSDWELMRRKSNAIRLACPELMIMIGGSFPRKELDGIIDIYDPQIGGGSATYSLTEEMTGLIAQSQARGERLFWYDAAGPMLPYPNVQCEEPLIASRAVFWMTWKYGVTGFEYYCYNIWSHNLPDKDGKRWPEKPFTPWGWGSTNGDGMLFYPGPDGPFSSVRFENIRDGIEDWESHHVLRDYVDALKSKAAGQPAEAGELLARAEALLKVPDEIVKDLRTWTWQPQVLLAARRNLGETIEALAKLVTEEEMLAARKARRLSQLNRQREMLKSRADAAGKAPAAEPAQ